MFNRFYGAILTVAGRFIGLLGITLVFQLKKVGWDLEPLRILLMLLASSFGGFLDAIHIFGLSLCQASSSYGGAKLGWLVCLEKALCYS